MTERVLAATDGSSFGQAAVRHAHEIARCSGAQLTVLHVLPDLPVIPLAAGAVEGWRAQGERLLANAAGAIGQAAAEFALVEARGRRTADVIAEEAGRRNADLVVLGSHGTGGHDPHLLGSVAERVSHTAAATVLLVRGLSAHYPSGR